MGLETTQDEETWGGNSRQAKHSLRGCRERPRSSLVRVFLRVGQLQLPLPVSAPHEPSSVFPTSTPQCPNLCSSRSSQVLRQRQPDWTSVLCPAKTWLALVTSSCPCLQHFLSGLSPPTGIGAPRGSTGLSRSLLRLLGTVQTLTSIRMLSGYLLRQQTQDLGGFSLHF